MEYRPIADLEELARVAKQAYTLRAAERRSRRRSRGDDPDRVDNLSRRSAARVGGLPRDYNRLAFQWGSMWSGARPSDPIARGEPAWQRIGRHGTSGSRGNFVI